jgi:hypothetical protein
MKCTLCSNTADIEGQDICAHCAEEDLHNSYNADVYADINHEGSCAHIAVVSYSATECQCMDCLRIWPKREGFVSDWPDADRG